MHGYPHPHTSLGTCNIQMIQYWRLTVTLRPTARTRVGSTPTTLRELCRSRSSSPLIETVNVLPEAGKCQVILEPTSCFIHSMQIGTDLTRVKSLPSFLFCYTFLWLFLFFFKSDLLVWCWTLWIRPQKWKPHAAAFTSQSAPWHLTQMTVFGFVFFKKRQCNCSDRCCFTAAWRKKSLQRMDGTVFSLTYCTVRAMQRHTRRWSTDSVLWGWRGKRWGWTTLRTF